MKLEFKLGTLKSLFLIFLYSMIIYSCEQEEDTDKKNYINFNNQNLQLSNGIIREYGQIRGDALGYNFDITINSSQIVYDSIANNFIGNGTQVHFELYSNSSSEIFEGTYYFNQEEEQIPFTFNNSYIADNYIFVPESGIKSEINQGTITVSKSGEKYIIEFNCFAQEYPVKGKFESTFISYKRDKFEKLKNYIISEDQIHDLDYGIRACAGQIVNNSDVNFIEMFLYSRTIDFSPVSGFSQSGNLLYFEIFSKDYSILPSGSYTFNNTSSTPLPFTFYFGLLFTDFNFSSNNYIGEVIAQGTLNIEYDNVTGIYKMNIDCITASGKNIKAQFINRLDFYKLVFDKKKNSFGINSEFLTK